MLLYFTMLYVTVELSVSGPRICSDTAANDVLVRRHTDAAGSESSHGQLHSITLFAFLYISLDYIISIFLNIGLDYIVWIVFKYRPRLNFWDFFYIGLSILCIYLSLGVRFMSLFCSCWVSLSTNSLYARLPSKLVIRN